MAYIITKDLIVIRILMSWLFYTCYECCNNEHNVHFVR